MRTAVILAACLAIVAMTSGVLLVIHLGSVKHPADHDSHHCSLCQQLLVQSKEFLVDPGIELVCATDACRVDVPEAVERVQNHRPRISQPRGPPSSCQCQPV